MKRFLPLLLLCSMSFLGQSQSALEQGAFVIETDNLLGPISDMQLLPNVGFAVTDRFVVRMGYSNILVTDGSYELESLGIAIGGKALLQNDLFVSIDLSASGTEFGSGNAFSDFDLAVAAQLECGRFIPINRSMYFAPALRWSSVISGDDDYVMAGAGLQLVAHLGIQMFSAD